MEPVTAWSPDRVCEWLKGLEASLQQYPFQEWQLSGQELLTLSYRELEQLGVKKIGHQELILDAVEKLCSLTYSMPEESLRSLTEKLRTVAHSLQMGIQGRWKVKSYSGHSATKLPTAILQALLDVILAAKGLFSLLNRYHFAELRSRVDSRNIMSRCQELGSMVQKEVTVYEREKDIISVCRHLVDICDNILSSCPEDLLSHTVHLESVQLVPVSPGDQLSPAEFCEGILVGDEVIQVNNQIVVGWSRGNLVRKLQEKPSGVTLVLKKVPVSKRQERAAGPAPIEDEENPSLLGRVTASVRSLSFRTAVQTTEATGSMGQEESELAFDSPQPGNSPDLPELTCNTARDRDEDSTAEGGDLLEASTRTGRGSVSSCPEMTREKDESQAKKSSMKGTRTAMSRRRVSCRELGRADCDGWLWKKKKESGVFLTSKWQRFWFVLKGPTLYWYTSQQEEKAEGLVKIPSYSIESAGEHKRKYVFKVRHQRFQTFFIAADNVNDMSKWINCLITAIQKYKKLHKDPPDSENECYSETEPEDEGSSSPRSQRSRGNAKPESHTLPKSKGRKMKESGQSPVFSPSTGRSKASGPTEDEMGMLFHQLKEGGVSITGQTQPLTHDHFRRSFIRRNKNPVINEKAHALRALQSTLKAKEAELQVINFVLEDSNLTADKFRQWKECHEDLFQEIERLAVDRSQGQAQAQAQSPEGSQESSATEQQVSGVRLSYGEQLVDTEDSGSPASGPEGGPEGPSGSSESFYI
ncbi:connector enhancer of kinase suppressor of ras 1 isoform X2 [Brienomyrus brachyistius]|uniref:connector enhancer of kinase suppressor of ras 1 isoform X2 n=1 Tax=Brienomyrus brachyistius TaxID=42636 RepID=UPI0020B3A8CA|nr:connector enhancer of kinase suppressor of ras 1 isoform X2 [Brienomyrus brachyistius]